MHLDLNFIICGIIIILFLIPFYIYRKQVYKLFSRNGDFNTFINDVKIHLKDTFPNINFEYDKIIEATKNEKDISRREILIIEDLVSQYVEFDYKLDTQSSIDKNLLWKNYEEGCIPTKDKKPNDWLKRKDLTYRRDNCRCKRCGLKIELNDAFATLIRSIENGGGYNFENLITLCFDCNKICSEDNENKNPKHPIIEEDLLKKVT
ncbi:HNH endonuclease [Arcobacter sp. CECT 8985]|uniref:HNH endonuclease n=1 Tax=Arcobacter sp. CECT 8985 TaxID=1935424 RepID=UPI00100B6993|nr:HNH endonuclease [Arcobacter sp. CECT 8985]RXJ83894.1 hypothetical protein CRU93_13125 [Arcobacter sp. CECT 8985]